MSAKGYDAALSQQDADDLDRWRFAVEIADVVLATPSDWSVRIGIFEKWGEGKSTVLGIHRGYAQERRKYCFLV